MPLTMICANSMRVAPSAPAAGRPAADGSVCQVASPACTPLAVAPGRRRIIRLVQEVGRVDRHHLAVLDLDDDLRQHDLAVVAVLDVGIEAVEARPRRSRRAPWRGRASRPPRWPRRRSRRRRRRRRRDSPGRSRTSPCRPRRTARHRRTTGPSALFSGSQVVMPKA